jgi:hypothetical protein
VMTADEHHEAMQEGIFRASLIRKDLAKYETEYYPEKVRALNMTYIATAKEIIKQGDFFLDKSQNFELGIKVAQIVENYRALLSTLGHNND